ncbi:hypothetical protein JCM3765_003988 [Sporobolomyces pararoseus]
MAFPSTLHSEIDQAVQGSIKEFIEKRNSGLPRAVVLATTSESEIVNSVAGFERFQDDLESAPKVTDESLFPLWSSTKLVTAIAAMQLVEQGKISLNDDASKYVKELRDLKVFKGFNDNGEPQLEENTHVCTVENLITHTAGFKYQYDPVYDKIQTHFGLTSIYDENSVRESLTKSPYLLPPGTAFSYGTANDWLALVVSDVSGLPLEDYLQKNIFEPLGIQDLTFTNPSSRVDVATTPEFEDAKLAPGSPYKFDAGRQFSQNISWGGAGLTGSPKSYLKILRMLLNGGKSSTGGQSVLKPETVDLMFSPRLDGELLKSFIPFVSQGNEPWSHKAKKQFEGVNYGLGGTLCGEGIPSGRSKGSLTWSGYANSFWVVDREKDVAFIVWSCLLPHSHSSVMDLWEKVEPKIYEGLAAAKKD